MTALQYYEEQIATFTKMFGNTPPRSFYQEMVLPQLRKQPNLAWKENTRSVRKKLEPATKAILNDLQEKYLSHSSDLLEIGCGPLLNHESYLSRLFGTQRSFNWNFSDLLATRENFSLDLTDQKRWKGPVFDAIVGCNSLDTLPYSSFESAFKKMSSILRPNGTLLHLADLNFFTTAFMDACAQKGGVLLPASDSLETLYYLPQNDFLRLLKPSEPHFELLSKWSVLHPQIQAIILNNAFISHQDLTPLIPFDTTHLEKLRIQDLFENYLQKAAAANNWKVLHCGTLNAQTEVDLTPGSSANSFDSDLLSTCEEWRSDVPLGKERIKSTVHVFAASTGGIDGCKQYGF